MTISTYATGPANLVIPTAGLPVPAACQNEAETRDIDRPQDDNETGPDQHRSS